MNHPLPISWHIQDWSDPRLARYVSRVLPRFQEVNFPFWLKGLDPPEQEPEYCRGVWVLGRINEAAVYDTDNGHWDDMARGGPGAESFVSKMLPYWRRSPWIKAWTIGNEPHPPADIEFLKKLNEFMVRAAVLMGEEGLLPGGPNLSVGWPDIGHAPYLGEGMSSMFRIVLHEYSAPAMWTTETWHCLRYRRTIQELLDAGFTDLNPVLLGETGIDGNVEPVYRPGTGWKTYASEAEYTLQLTWQARHHLDDYPQVESVFIFTDAPWGWGWDDFLPTDTLFDRLGDAVVAGYDIEEKPEPPPPPPFNITDVTDELPIHPTEVFETRDAPATTVVIHHAGYTYPADASEEDVREHLDVIAQWQVDNKGWPGIAYHFVVDGMGRIWQTNHLDTISYHSGSEHYNEVSVGICMLGAFHLDVDPTEAQLEATNCLIQWLTATLEQDSMAIMAHKAIVATACPGKISRWWDKLTVPSEDCGFEEEEEEEGEAVIEIFDQTGRKLDMTFEQVCEGWGIQLVEADPPEGATVWRLRGMIWDKSPNTVYRTYCRDEGGAAQPGIMTFLAATPGDYTIDLPPDTAPRFTEAETRQPIDPATGQPYPNVAIKHPSYLSNADGYMEHSLGVGSNTVPPRPVYQWAWVAPGDHKWYSDWVRGIGGMWADENGEHQMWWPIFVMEVEGDDDPENPPTPSPEGGDYVVEFPEIEIDIKVTVPAFSAVVRPVEEEE